MATAKRGRGRPKQAQMTIWQAIEASRRAELHRIASYTQKHLKEYDRYSKSLALLPPSTVIHDLYDFLFRAIPEVEGPVCFANAWATISHLLTRKRVKIETIKDMPIFTWDWEMIVGLSSMSKSLPIKTLMRWLHEEIKRYPADLTDAVLKTELSNDSAGFWLVDEAGELLKEFRNPQSSKRGLLLSIVDTPELEIARRGKKSLSEYEKIVIKEPALTIVANTTISDFVRHIGIDEFFSGMLQRWNICLVDRFMREDRSGTINIDEDERRAVVSDVKTWLDSIPHGRSYHISSKAQRRFDSWYQEHLSFGAVVKEVEQGRESILSFKQRQKLNIIRCAVVYQALIDPASDTIDEVAMQYSIRLAQWRLSNLYSLLENYLYFNEADKHVKTIVRLLSDTDGGKTRTELLRGMSGLQNMRQLDEVLQAMLAEEIITCNGKRYLLAKAEK